MTIQEIAAEFAGIQANYRLLDQQFKQKKQQAEILKKQIDIQQKARWIITEVAQNTQQRFCIKFENLVSMAIQSVFDRPLQFCLEIERKRNKMECSMMIKEVVNGQERIYDDIEGDIGGGVIDVVSFACRIVLWSLQNPRSRNVLIFDEPGKNLGILLPLFGQMVVEISRKLGFQIIIITHDISLMEIADRSYQVTHDGNKSSVKLVKTRTAEELKKAPVKISRFTREDIRDAV